MVLEAGSALVALRLRGSAPAATLVVEAAAVATFGGPPAWPLPAPDPQRRWDAIAQEVLEAAAREARPTLLLPADLGACDDAALAPADAVALAAVAPAAPTRVVLHPSSWREAAAAYL